MTCCFQKVPIYLSYETFTAKENIPGSPEAIKYSLRIAKLLRNSAKVNFDPNKSTKELYSELLDKEYDIS